MSDYSHIRHDSCKWIWRKNCIIWHFALNRTICNCYV